MNRVTAMPAQEAHMINEPGGDALLDAARKVLMDELLPLLPRAESYQLRMVARAMGIAARELASGAASEAHAAGLIAQFLAGAGLPDLPADEATLARLIRTGRLPPTAQGQLPVLLAALTRGKLALSNPRFLPPAPDPGS